MLKVHHTGSAIRLIAILLALASGSVHAAAPASPQPNLIYALTEGEGPWAVTSIYGYDQSAAASRLLYSDADGDARFLSTTSGDRGGLVGRVTPSGSAFLVGRTVSEDDPAACPARLVRIDLADSQATSPSRPLFPLPLIYGPADSRDRSAQTSLLAIARNGERFALVAPRPLWANPDCWAVLVTSGTGDVEWEFTLGAPSLRVSDLAWSDDGTLLAWLAVIDDPEASGKRRPVEQEGLYVADVAARTVRLVRRCRGEALAWGPSSDRVTLAPALAPGRSDGHVLRVILLPSGTDVEEFSVAGRVSTIAYSADKRHLAVQTESNGRQEVWVFQAAGGWGRRVYERPPDAGHLSLLGWARLRPADENP